LTTDLESGDGETKADVTPSDPPTQPAANAPATRELPAVPATGTEDQCSACGAPLARDQRYCVECGERRGQSTLPAPESAPEPQTGKVRATTAPRPPHVSSGAALVAGVGVLLLAIGLGVLIGRLGNNNNTTTHAAAPTVITVGGGGSAVGTTAASTPASTPRTTPTTVHVTKVEQAKLKAAAAATKPPPPAVQKKATQAAGKVLGNSANLAPPTVTQGQSCTQAGCQNGHFTGNFFGP
jgi:hypothetical protein